MPQALSGSNTNGADDCGMSHSGLIFGHNEGYERKISRSCLLRKLYFGPECGKRIDNYGSSFTLTRLWHNDRLHVGCIYLEAGGLVGRHQATTAQLFIVVNGSG